MLKQRLKVLLSIVSIQLLVGQALACIGSGESYNIGFREGSNPGDLIIHLREIKSDSLQELIDDTGYVSVHLAITRLAKDAREQKTKTITEPSETLNFLRARVDHMKSYFKAHLDPAMNAKFKAAIEKLEESLKEKPATSDALVAGISDINSFFYDSKIEIMASQRKSVGEAFSEEIPLSDIKLPTYVVTRSIGCNAGISSFNTNIPKAATPGRSRSGTAPVTR